MSEPMGYGDLQAIRIALIELERRRRRSGDRSHSLWWEKVAQDLERQGITVRQREPNTNPKPAETTPLGREP